MNKLIHQLVIAIFTPVIGISACAEITVSDAESPSFGAMQRDVVFSPLPDVEQQEIVMQLINGTVVDPRKFPAVFRMTTGGTCTASLIGPETILLAAHCIDDAQSIQFVAGGQTVRGICRHAPGYHKNFAPDQDWALCGLQHRVEGIAYESVDIDQKMSVDDDIVLTGFGCTVEDGKLDRKLRIGFSRVVNAPDYWPIETNTIYTEDLDNEGAILCPGDSGGPAFRFTGGIDSSRSIVGVNSRTTYSFGFSLVSATASQEGASFIRNWAETFKVEICGVNRDLGCK